MQLLCNVREWDTSLGPGGRPGCACGGWRGASGSSGMWFCRMLSIGME